MSLTRYDPAAEQERKAARRAENLKALATATLRPVSGSSYAGGVSGKPIDKENAIEHEGYRRLVAALPCARCFVQGYSQAAHPPPTGKGRKEDDRAVFPLCCTRPDQVGCHVLFDQYKLMPHDAAVEQAREWGRRTRARIINLGQWPASLPKWTENP
jgi:hypothetical protein